MRLQIKKSLKNPAEFGDTIVEVLIAIAIAAFAVGISYSTAERSLQQAIAAREHNEALNIMENQLTDLQLRFDRSSQTDFTTNFASQNNYCLDNSANTPTDSGWKIDSNHQNNSVTNSSLLSLKPSGPYASGCHESDGGANYYWNITTANSGGADNSTLYTVTVRWARLGGGINKASIFYKLNNSPSSG